MYMMQASPGFRGRLDRYEYFLDRDGSSRLARSPYFVYFSDAALQTSAAGASGQVRRTWIVNASGSYVASGTAGSSLISGSGSVQ